MYPWIVFLHVLSVFVFMLTHGATAFAMFRLRTERDPERLRGLLDLRDSASLPFSISGAVMFLTGVALGFIGGWWRTGWIWTSLGLLIVISIVMGIFGRNYLDKVRQLVSGNPHPAPAKELEAALNSGRAVMLTIIGLAGFVAILWLMMFKPF